MSVSAEDFHETKAFAEQGDAFAQFQLGATYDLGEEGVPQDDKEAAKWYLKAAEQGHKIAQLKTGRMYLEGRGVQQDYIEAWAWLFMARFGTPRPESTSVPQGPNVVKYKVSAANPEGSKGETHREIGEDKFPPFGSIGQAWKFYDIATSKLSDEELATACIRGAELFGIMFKAPQSTTRQNCIELIPNLRNLH